MLRYRLRTLLIVVAIVALATQGLRLWRLPHAFIGTYPNGVRAWEQWHRRNFTGGEEYQFIVRYYTDGRISLDTRTGQTRYWSPDGRRISVDEWTKFVLQDCNGEFPEVDAATADFWTPRTWIE
jgi:hypothetical protein